jgi:enediyne biosynthesis protein E4
MGAADRPFTGWGTGFFDLDNDGFLDLATANGRVARGPVRSEARLGSFWNRFGEANLLFRGDGSGRFLDISGKAGSFTQRIEVHRAVAFADLRNRGALDLLVGNLDNTLRVHRNDAVPPGNHWLQVLPMLGKREAIGAKVTISAGGAKRSAPCLRAYSYVSSNDPRVHFGLGSTTTVDDLEIAWPSGSPKRERFAVSGIDRSLSPRQGEGTALD